MIDKLLMGAMARTGSGLGSKDSAYALGIWYPKYICRYDGNRWRVIINTKRLRR